jgi:hypothetical protein
MKLFGKLEEAEKYKNKKWPKGIRIKLKRLKLSDGGYAYMVLKHGPLFRNVRKDWEKRITRLEKKMKKLTQKKARK